MAADFFIADTENGRFVDDPDQDALLLLIAGLNHDDNTFVTINPADESAAWYASVSLLPDGGYEVELADPDRQEHQHAIHTDHDKIAQHVSDWLATHQHAR
ncbi:hypothetical protein ACTMTI_52050 [Nonomuraea sp. H19]|uniref:hypothetical protein n=1 Tax=Nonomuraea sp. H19 TaxID=3452206 RepID=UPI003F8A87BC